jgi:oligopeptide/dipeptide ABC transporter ATP-binding protein
MLEVESLSIDFEARHKTLHVLDRVSLDIAPGEIVGIVGESGSGKTVLATAISGLLDPAATIRTGEIRWRGNPIPPVREQRNGTVPIAQIFQNPRASLNPIRSVGRQLADVAGRNRVAALLESVRVSPEKASAYPFELSGGQCQRIGIALALACEPELLVADEPTTGLDVLTEAAILDLMGELSRARKMATLLVTHNLALAAARCQRIIVIHAGQVAETGPSAALVEAARHPYAAALLASVPQHCQTPQDLLVIPGALPDLATDLPPCRFSQRCDRHAPDCDAAPLPELQLASDHRVACHHPLC